MALRRNTWKRGWMDGKLAHPGRLVNGVPGHHAICRPFPAGDRYQARLGDDDQMFPRQPRGRNAPGSGLSDQGTQTGESALDVGPGRGLLQVAPRVIEQVVDFLFQRPGLERQGCHLRVSGANKHPPARANRADDKRAGIRMKEANRQAVAWDQSPQFFVRRVEKVVERRSVGNLTRELVEQLDGVHAINIPKYYCFTNILVIWSAF